MSEKKIVQWPMQCTHSHADEILLADGYANLCMANLSARIKQALLIETDVASAKAEERRARTYGVNVRVLC